MKLTVLILIPALVTCIITLVHSQPIESFEEEAYTMENYDETTTPAVYATETPLTSLSTSLDDLETAEHHYRRHRYRAGHRRRCGGHHRRRHHGSHPRHHGVYYGVGIGIGVPGHVGYIYG